MLLLQGRLQGRSEKYSAKVSTRPTCKCSLDDSAGLIRPLYRLTSRRSFALWVCEQHNLVNAKLGKETFPCSLKKLDERWRTGSAKCTFREEEEKQSASESLGQDES